MDGASLTLGSPAAALSSLTQAGATDALQAARRGDDEEAAKAFEGVFARLLVREVRRALPEGFFGEGAGADVYESWFDEHLGQALVERDALGLAGMVKAAVGRASAAEDAESATEGAGTGEAR